MDNLERAGRIEYLAAQIRAESRQDYAWGKLLRSYSIAKAIIDLAREKRTGVEAEVHRELERGQATQTNNSVLVPWSALATRADTVASAAGGGYLVQTENLTAADVLRPKLLAGPLGQTIIPAPAGSNVNLPRQTGAGTAYWLSTETSTATEQEQTFGQVAFSPKTVGAYTELSRLLKLQSNADQVIAHDLTNVLARSIDKGQLHGTGTAGTLTGLTNTSGTGTFSAATCALTTLVDAQASLGDAIGPSTGMAVPLTVAQALRKRTESSAGVRSLWEGPLSSGTAAGMPARSSTAVTTANVVLGTWEYLNLVVWGNLEVSVNPYAGFQSGISGIRALLTCDSGVTWPAAFTIAKDFS
jgi:HK97 family phage major capsid protein